MSSNRTPTALEQFFMMLIRSNGTDLPKRPIANFLGGSIADDPVNDQTLITLGGILVSVANLTANFTQPAVGSLASAVVSLSSGYDLGVTVFVRGGGFYTVTAIPDSIHLTLLNTGAKGNVAPASTVTAGPLVIPTGPPSTLIQNNGTPVTMRGTLDLVGLTYADDSAGDRMIFTAEPPDLPAPGAPIAAAVTLTATDRWRLFTVGTASYTISQPNAVAGRDLDLQHDGVGDLSGAFTTTFSNGGSAYWIEDPVTRVAATSVPLLVSLANYKYRLDPNARSGSGLLRIMQVVR